MTCAETGPDLVALALGQLPGEEAAEVEAHLAQCAPCRAEFAAARRIVAASRAAPSPEPSAGAEARLLAAVRAERDAGPAAGVPVPVSRPRRGARILTVFVPLAAAAAVLAVMIDASREPPAEFIDGEGFLLPARSDTGGGAAEVIRGAFAFGEGGEVEAGRSPFTMRLTLPAADGASAAGGPRPGLVELKLLPGARIRRRAANAIRLVAGAVEVAAGPLAEPLTVDAPPGYATVRGTRFTATTAENRLVVAVSEGAVELGRENGPSETLAAGEEGLVDSERLLRRAADGRPRGAGFLTPRAELEVLPPEPGRRGPPDLAATWSVGDGGPVTIMAFDDSEPRFLVRLAGPDGREREVKLLRSMLLADPPAPAEGLTFRLTGSNPYRLLVRLDGIGLAPGHYTARVRSMSYRPRGSGAEWLGVVESDPVQFEVPAK